MTTKWTASDIPSQTGRTAVVTGTGGLGFQTALELARAGAEVIIAGRNPAKGLAAIAQIRAQAATSLVRFEQLDLANLKSIEAFARRLQDHHPKTDLLINNAAVMMPPKREVTSDGFELQFGTNYLGHFALTAHLMPLLRQAPQPRVVTLSSLAARDGILNFDDLQSNNAYQPMPAYSQSKLACLLFAFELQRQSDAANWNIQSIAAHPGISRTDLLHNAPGRWSPHGLARTFLWFLFQPAAQGALPTLYAATSNQAQPGGYYGPNRLKETRGFPAPAYVPKQAQDRKASERLWRVSEQLTGLAPVTPADSLYAG